MLARQALYHLSQEPSSLCFSCFSNTVSCLCNPPIYISCIAGMTGVSHHAWPTILKFILLFHIPKLTPKISMSHSQYHYSNWLLLHFPSAPGTVTPWSQLFPEIPSMVPITQSLQQGPMVYYRTVSPDCPS
jgi:hypothetical protein